MRRPYALSLLWTLLIVAIVLPWTSFQDHAHWQNIRWKPFLTPPYSLRDIVLNVLLYVPLGYWLTKGRGQGRWWRAGAYALALSVSTEFTQVFSHGRFPSATDVICNVGGALWGIRWARR